MKQPDAAGILSVLTESEYLSRQPFDLPNPQRGRNLSLNDLLPRPRDFEFALLMTEFSLGGVEGDSLDTLFTLTGLARTEQSVERLRLGQEVLSNTLIEGGKCLTESAKHILRGTLGRNGNVLIRNWVSASEVNYWEVPLDAYFALDDLIEDLPETIGEYEIVTEDVGWLLRIRDDDPIVFLAAAGTAVSRICSADPARAMRVSGDFKYC